MNNNMEKMLEQASKKLGTNTETLKKALQKGDLSSALGGLKNDDIKKLNEILNNQDLKKKLLNSPEALNLMKQFTNNNHK